MQHQVSVYGDLACWDSKIVSNVHGTGVDGRVFAASAEEFKIHF